MFKIKIGDEWEQISDAPIQSSEEVPYADDSVLYDMFQSYIEDGEQILFVIGAQNMYAKLPVDVKKTEKRIKIIGNVYKVIVVLFALGVIIGVHGSIKSFGISILLILPYVLIDMLLPFLIIILIIVIIKKIGRTNKDYANYAITDRKIISSVYGVYKQIDLREIVSTKAHMNGKNIGKISIRAEWYEDVKVIQFFSIHNVKDPFRVKYILDQAIEKRKNDPYQDQ